MDDFILNQELQQLIEHAQQGLATATEKGEQMNVWFYAEALKQFQGENGPLYGLVLRELNRGGEVKSEHESA